MALESGFPPAAVGNIGGARGLASQLREDLSTADLDFPGVEPRCCYGKAQQLESFVAIFGERAHGALDRVALGRKVHLNRSAFQAIRKSRRIEIAGAGIEQRS